MVGKKEDGLEGELSIAEVEKVLEGGAQEIQDHGIVVTLCPEPANERDADASSEGLVDSGFVFELRMLGFNRLELDGDLFARYDVGAQVDVSKRATTDFAANSILVPDTEILRVIRCAAFSSNPVFLTYHGGHFVGLQLSNLRVIDTR